MFFFLYIIVVRNIAVTVHRILYVFLADSPELVCVMDSRLQTNKLYSWS